MNEWIINESEINSAVSYILLFIYNIIVYIGQLSLRLIHSFHLCLIISKIFANPGADVRKIIIGTNLAETSITIDDCVFVIDAGRMKLSR